MFEIKMITLNLQLFAEAGTLVNASTTYVNAYTGEVVRTLNLRFLPSSLEGYIDIY